MAAGAFHTSDRGDAPPAISPSSGDGTSGQTASAAHQRTYQACIPCRQRKVRCDLGSVDNPHDPPCSRCKREAKECYFSATRRKKKTSSTDVAEGGRNANDAAADEPPDDGVYEIRGHRKRLRTSAPADYDEMRDDSPEPPRTPGGSAGRAQPLRRPTQPKVMQYGEEAEKASESTAAILQQAELHGGHDALKVLYHAALRGRAQSAASSTGQPSYGSFPPPPAIKEASPSIENGGRASSYSNGPMSMFQGDESWKSRNSQHTTQHSQTVHPPYDAGQYTTAVKAWSRFRFVRAGWFTAREGIDYITYFYERLAPLTPVALPDFRQPTRHKNLLEEEPMLAITMLLIASRHMKLEGPGSHSRPYAVHQKLWNYLSGMLNRVMWGQEQFGGGLCGAGGQPSCDVNPLSRKGLRTLGTVESLVLLTEWHPRAMHFPPDEDDDELMLPEQPVGTPELGDNMDAPRGIGGQRMDAWLEPCWRSDRMCWMLLGQAMALAFEIGAFDASEWRRHARAADGQPLSADKLGAYDKRRCHVRDLLLVYVTQTSGRLGLTSMLPASYSKPEDSSLFQRPLGHQDSVQEVTLYFWLRMAALMREGTRQIFANKTFTRDLIRNGDYKAALERLQPPLQAWREEFDSCAAIPKYMRCILGIEYEYCRVYINALALQAVAERCANDHPSPVGVIDPPLENIRSAADGTRPENVISPSTLSKWLGGDRHYLVTVGDAARNLLKIVVDDLFPQGYLRHAPVRTYFRIISVAIMLLKSFALGAFESDVSESIHLMEQTVRALRTCIIDDVHVASRFADLLDILINNLKPRLVRIAADGRTSRPRASHTAQHPSSSSTASKPSNFPSNQTHLNRQPPHHPHPQQSPSLPHQNPLTPSLSYQPFPLNEPTTNLNGSHPLYGISNDTYDLLASDNQYSVMPPPGFNTSSPNGSASQYLARDSNGSYTGYAQNSSSNSAAAAAAANSDFDPTLNQDWLALPLDPLLGMSADVNQTMYGPELNGHDMLELLLYPNTGQNYG